MYTINFIKSQTRLIVWLILFLPVTNLAGQTQKYFFDNYSVKQGLSEQKVYTLLQDSKDYIWLGTANGLSRFDGKKIENFTSGDNLAAGGVKSITEDSLGYIWFGHLNGGITRYDGQKFEQVSFDSLKLTGDVTGIVQIKNQLWFTSSNEGAIQVDYPVRDLQHMKAKLFRGKEGLSDQVFGATKLRDGSLICVTAVGLKKYNNEEKKFEGFRMPHMTTYFSTSCLFEDSHKNLWFGTYNGGVYKYIMSESRMEYYDLIRMCVASNFVFCINEDNQGRIWIGTWGGGIALFDGDKFRKFNSGDGLIPTNIYKIIEDVEGNILIADRDNGLTIYKGDASNTIIEKEILPNPNVNAICEDLTGGVWFGTNSGISRYYPGGEKKTLFFNKINNAISDDIRFIKLDKEGNIWIGSNDGGVIMYNVKTSRFEAQPYINSTIYKDGKVRGMEIDKNNNLWIGTSDGVAEGTINGQNFKRYNSMDSVIIAEISALYCDPEGDMWIGIEKIGGKLPGVIKFNSVAKDFKRIPALSGILAKTLVMDKKGILWIGTSEGLKAFGNDSVIFTITQKDGLLSNNINLLSTGDDGSIYIGTNNGLNRYFPETKRMFSYTERNGFTGIETK